MKNTKKRSHRKSIKSTPEVNRYGSWDVIVKNVKKCFMISTSVFSRIHFGSVKRRSLKIIKRYRKQFYALLILFIIILLQSTLLNYFRIFNVKPDAILAALVIFVPFFRLRWSITFAFFGGIFRDIFSILPFGFNAIIYILWIILANRISRRLSVENIFIRSALLCLIILLNNLALESILFVLGRSLIITTFLKIIFIECILTLLLALPMYKLFVYLLIDKSLQVASGAIEK